MKVHSSLCPLRALGCLACQVWQQEKPESMGAGHQGEQSPMMTSGTSMRKTSPQCRLLIQPNILSRVPFLKIRNIWELGGVTITRLSEVASACFIPLTGFGPQCSG